MNTNDIVKYSLWGAAFGVIAYAVYTRKFPAEEKLAAERKLLLNIAEVLMEFSDRARTNLQPMTRKDIANHLVLQCHQFNQTNNTNFAVSFSIESSARYSALKVVKLAGRHCKQEVKVYCN